MSEIQRVLDLDAIKTIPVRIGGRDFNLTQQRRAVLEKVFARIYTEDHGRTVPDVEEGKWEKFLGFTFQVWEDSMPIIALILGYEESNPETPGVIQHLQEHLSFPGATQLFQEWWTLNQVDRFFGRAGNPLIPERIVSDALASAEEQLVLN